MREVEVDQRLLDKWLGIGKVQLITELELLPVLVGMAHYNGEIRGRRVLWFVDNNSVRDMLSKGSSPMIQLFTMLLEVGRLIHQSHTMVWYSRVPSKSNVADFPSRQQPEQAAQLIGGVVGPKLSLKEDLVELCINPDSFFDLMKHSVK